MARTRGAVPVKRGPSAQQPDVYDPSTFRDFTSLKKHETESRREFRTNFPTNPDSGSALEMQQEALLRQQEDRLRSLRASGERGSRNNYPPAQEGLYRAPSGQLLNSETAFIDLKDGNTPFPDDLDRLRQRNDSARSRRRAAGSRADGPSAATFGSQASLNVDALQERNKHRLQRLTQMQDPYYEQAQDSDELLDRFMRKQAHERRPSANTLLDDTWLQPTDRAVR